MAHGANWLNAVPASKEGGFLSDTLTGNISLEDPSSSEEDRSLDKGGCFINSHPSAFASGHASRKRREKWGTQFFPPQISQGLLADAELPNDRLIALGIVSFEVVEQATPLADQHEQAAARAVVLLVRLEVVGQLANAFTDDGDLNLGTPRVSRVRLILVNDRLFLLSG
jgi:hypothetical protein